MFKVMDGFKREILGPEDTRKIVPQASIPIWTYKYTHPSKGFVLAIATAGAPGSEKLSLGGFRIAPKERTARSGFSAEREAIELANGMDEKVFWSRLTNVAGPLGIKELQRIVGGKCVMAPAEGSKIGEPDDFALLDFGATCLKDFESHSKVYITTGQDLGHGVMSDGKTSSLIYLHGKFIGSVLEDTSKPTGEGNFYCLKGMLRGVGLKLPESYVGLIGCGNVGEHLLRRLLENGAKVAAVESSPTKIEKLRNLGVQVFEPKDKASLFSLPINAVCVNASGGSLDDATIASISNHKEIKVVCGSENLAMPNPSGAGALFAAKKIYCPTELCGMMGYLTAVEEYYCTKQGKVFDVTSLFEASRRLEEVGFQGVTEVLRTNNKSSFEDAVKKLFSAPTKNAAHS